MRTADNTTRYGRRAVLGALAGGVVLGTAGCDLFGDPEPPPGPDPLEPLRAQAQALADQYTAAIAAAGDLAGRLGPLRDAHLTHVAELNKIISSPPPSASPSAPAAPPADPATPPADPATLLVALRAAEEAGQRDAVAACLAAPGTRAALVGSIAACRASHQEVLR